MSSMAARANARIKRRTAKGISAQEAFIEVTTGPDIATGTRKETVYARFPDKSYMRLITIRGEQMPQVLSHHSSKTQAEKIIQGINAACHRCGTELWCQMDGKTAQDERFELPGATVNLCKPCQRQIVTAHLVGE